MASEEEYICDQCSAKFDSPQKLGAHKFRAHGVQGASARRTRKPKRQSQPKQAQAQTNQTVVSALHDRLLETVFPSGIPPKKEVLEEISGWLNEADRLTHF